MVITLLNPVEFMFRYKMFVIAAPPFSFNIKENGTWSVHFFCTFPDGTKHKNPILKEN